MRKKVSGSVQRNFRFARSVYETFSDKVGPGERTVILEALMNLYVTGALDRLVSAEVEALRTEGHTEGA